MFVAPRAARTSPRRQPRQARSRVTVDAILEATTYLLAEVGFEKTTTNAIARRAGVNIASLYQYFPSKDAILAELSRRHAREVRKGALDLLRASAPEARRELVRGLVRHLVEEHRRSPALHTALVAESARLRLPTAQTDVDADLAAERARRVSLLDDRAELSIWMPRRRPMRWSTPRCASAATRSRAARSGRS